ncbi:hypothetical protein MCOR25_005034 [Pyricularia grisea]|nr:hypothetical protein MCOR25_005034 [Pyricularia grisea]
MNHYLPSEHGSDMDSSFSSVAVFSDMSASPASSRTSATTEVYLSSPSRSTSAMHYGIHGMPMHMSPQPALMTQDYVHMPSPITEGYVHVPSGITQDYVNVHSQSNRGFPSDQHYRNNAPAPGYFPLHHSLPDFSTSAPFISANRGYNVRDAESPSAMSIWSYDGATPCFEGSCSSPVSVAAHTHISPTPSPRAFCHRPQRRITTPNGTRARSSRRADTHTTLEGITRIPPNRHACSFPGCGRTYARPEHMKRHEKTHDEDATVFTCKICLDLMPPEKVHRVKARLDNFIMHVKNHTDIKGAKTSASRTKYHPGALAYLRSLEARQKNKGRGTRKPDLCCKL